MPVPKDLNDLVTITEAAKLLPNESESSLRRKARMETIAAVKLGQEWFISPAEIARIKTEGESLWK